MRYIDLTHTFGTGMPVYPGDPIPEFVQIADLHKDGYTDYQIKTGMHVGTHMDAPLHMLDGGKRLSDVAIEKFLGKGRLIDARGASTVSADYLEKSGVQKDDIVLVMTGFSKNIGKRNTMKNFQKSARILLARQLSLASKL